MIVKGGARAGGANLSAHLSRTDTNERVAVLELRDVAAQTLPKALREMEALASGIRCKSPLYHANIDPRADERLTPEQWTRAVDALEERLGLTGQPRAVVQHVKGGREHVHVVWSRVDVERSRVISDSHNFRRHEEVSRALEREFGHRRVQGAHVEREGVERPPRTPSHAEMQQAARSGLDPKAIKAEITGLWQRTDSGRAFAAAMSQAGYELARGDKRDLVVVDRAGGGHSLARRIDGAKAADIRARMGDLDLGAIPSVQEAQQRQAEAQTRRQEELRQAQVLERFRAAVTLNEPMRRWKANRELREAERHEEAQRRRQEDEKRLEELERQREADRQREAILEAERRQEAEKRWREAEKREEETHRRNMALIPLRSLSTEELKAVAAPTTPPTMHDALLQVSIGYRRSVVHWNDLRRDVGRVTVWLEDVAKQRASVTQQCDHAAQQHAHHSAQAHQRWAVMGRWGGLAQWAHKRGLRRDAKFIAHETAADRAAGERARLDQDRERLDQRWAALDRRRDEFVTKIASAEKIAQAEREQALPLAQQWLQQEPERRALAKMVLVERKQEQEREAERQRLSLELKQEQSLKRGPRMKF